MNNHTKTTYASPKVKTVEIKTRTVLCQSGNESIREKDCGDGGFEEYNYPSSLN